VYLFNNFSSRVICENLSVTMYHPKYQTQHCSLFTIYWLRKCYILFWLHLSFFSYLVEDEPFCELCILCIDGYPGSIANGLLCHSCVGPVVMWWVICRWLSFSEYHQVWSRWKHSHCPFHFGLCCTFLKNVELLRVATCSREHKFLVHFAVCLQDR